MATLTDLSQWLAQLSIEPTVDDLYQAADHQRERILTRTASGLSVDLSPFAPYAKKTGKTGTVDLRKTGEMLDSIVIESDDTSARIMFADDEQAAKAAAHNEGTEHLPERYFFGVSLQDREDIVGEFRLAVYRRVNGLS